ncbi:hypothetical protein Mal52_54980 [Symmachiella dynata]|uniref:Twin-arginine translocation signal domain-containing protein n=2 Tax=Symmachiella dynata TaxID=2527995 RepID=A0A517ZWY5_9PLAN|nr:hypothetical protein Mal52_54980 [Symmachiella dynata]
MTMNHSPLATNLADQCTGHNRRQFLKTAAAAGLSITAMTGGLQAAAPQELPPTRTITRGPKFHWFGYYDKLEFDPSGRYVLGMEVDFEHRSPRADDEIKIGMVDLQDNDRWIELGSSTAWGWQQGCMLQWRPGSDREIVWNDREDGRYVCRIMDVFSRKQRTIDQAIYALSPDGRTAVGLDFARVNDVRPGYGYVGIPDSNSDELAPADSGIYRVDLETGESQTIIPIAEALKTVDKKEWNSECKHYFNHLLVNPDGTRFIMLHRWQYPDGHRRTRMLTANTDGKDLRIVDDNGLTSHFIWRDPNTILAYSEQQPHGRGFFLFQDETGGEAEFIGKGILKRDGHCSYLPGDEWILNDTYPDSNRNQMPHLFHIATGKVVPLGYFRSAPEYKGEWRCDTHPRFSPDGTKVVVDTPHGGHGRQLHLIDISGIVS